MKFKWSENAKFYPWVRNKANMPRKVLLLSANHNDNDWSRDLTQDAALRLCKNQLKQNPFFYGIVWTTYGNKFIRENMRYYIPFYNHIKISLAGPRKSLPPDNYTAVKKPFFEALEMITPNIIFTFGYSLRYYL